MVHVPGDYTTLQGAIDSCQNGDTILVAPGTYRQSLNTNEKSILLASHFLTENDTNLISETRLQGASDPVITVNSQADSIVIVGFTIFGGSSDHGAGINVSYGHLVLKNNVVGPNTTGNWRVGYGGGIYALSSTLHLLRNKFIHNDSDYGGAIYATQCTLQIKNCTFEYNNAQEYGGALNVGGSVVDIDQNTFIQNWALRGGGAIDCNGSGYLRNNTIIGYVTSDYTYYGAQYGGAINCGGTLKIVNNRIEKHAGGEGSAIRCSGDVWIQNNLILHNTESLGAGIFIQGNPKIINNTFYGNDGYAIIYFKSGYPEITNNIIWGNTLRSDWKTIHVEAGIPDLITVTYSNIQDGYDGTGNISVNPLFRDELNGDFHLKSLNCGSDANSPCIDAGSPLYVDSMMNCLAGLGTGSSDVGAYGGGALNPTATEDENRISSRRSHSISIKPNPFNNSTQIELDLRQFSTVSLTMCNISGAKVRTLYQGSIGPGTKVFSWNGRDDRGNPSPSGIYILRIRMENRVYDRKVVLLK